MTEHLQNLAKQLKKAGFHILDDSNGRLAKQQFKELLMICVVSFVIGIVVGVVFL